MIEYRMRYWHSGVGWYNTLDITNHNFGEITIDKKRFELPQIGNEITLGGEFVLRNRAFDVLVGNNYHSETQANGRTLQIFIQDTETGEEIIFYVDTQKIKWDMERCQCHISEGSLGGLQKINDDLKKIWNEEINIEHLGSNIDLSKSLFRVVRSDNNGTVEWLVFDITNVNSYWDKVDNMQAGNLVTNQNAINAVQTQDPDRLYSVAYISNVTPSQGTYTERSIWIVEQSGLNIIKPSFILHQDQYTQNVITSVVKIYKNFRNSINDDAKLVDAMRVTDVFQHILGKYNLNLELHPHTQMRIQTYANATGNSESLYMLQKSNAKRPWGERKAKKYGISLQDLITDLCAIFRCQWFIMKDGNGGYYLSFFNPRLNMAQYNNNLSLFTNYAVIGLFSHYNFNAYEIQDAEVLNIYSYLDSQPREHEIEIKENKRMETVRNLTREEYATGERKVESITRFMTDPMGIVFQDFGEDSEYNVQSVYLEYRERSNSDLPITNSEIRTIMEDIGNEFFADEGFVLYASNGYLNPNERQHNATLNMLSRNRVSWWDDGDKDNKIWLNAGANTQLAVKTKREFEEVQVRNCNLVPEEMEVMRKDSEWYFAVTSSCNLNTRILNIKFEKND